MGFLSYHYENEKNYDNVGKVVILASGDLKTVNKEIIDVVLNQNLPFTEDCILSKMPKESVIHQCREDYIVVLIHNNLQELVNDGIVKFNGTWYNINMETQRSRHL